MNDSEIMAYLRPGGGAGIRNYILVLSSVVCANRAVAMIKDRADNEELIAITHQHGCSQGGIDREQTLRTLQGTASHPNVAAVLVVGLGCETIKAERIASKALEKEKPCEILEIQNCGGVAKTVQQGLKIVEDFNRLKSSFEREPVNISEITLGVECGGSDSFSGITANPAVGEAADLLISKNGRVILSEIPEMIGAEHVLAEKCINDEVKDKLLSMVKNFEKKALKAGIDIREANPSPGNKEGGITTLEEKSLGCIYKGGTSQIKQVVDYAESPEKDGLIIMNTPGNDVESMSGMAAGGAQIMAFTTGRGTPAGCAVAPTIKIATNSRLYNNMKNDIDINSGEIIDGKATKKDMGEIIFNKIVKVIEGEKTKSELLGQFDFSINRIGPTF